MTDPHVIAWTDQFGALLRDKCRQMLGVLQATDWDDISHVFQDPYDEEQWRLAFNDGEFTIQNISEPEGACVIINLEKLGINL